MVNPRGLLGAVVILIFVAGAPEADCGLGPRHTSNGQGRVLEVVAPNLLKVKLVNPDGFFIFVSWESAHREIGIG